MFKNPKFFGKLETKDDILQAIKEISTILYVLGGLQIFISLLIWSNSVFLEYIPGLLMITLSFLWQKSKLLLLSVVLLIIAVNNLMTAYLNFRANTGIIGMILAFIILLISAQAVNVTINSIFHLTPNKPV